MGALSPEKLANDLVFLLSQASYALTNELAVGLADLGITPRGYCVLATAMTDEMTQGQLAELCALDKTTMVVTIDELERAGYAERRQSDTDRRARMIAVTKSGERIVARAERVVDRIYDDVLSTLPRREREAFKNGLYRLVTERLATPSHTERPVRRRPASVRSLVS